MDESLPNDVQTAVAPLFDALSLDQAMTQLVVARGGEVDLVEKVIASPEIAGRPALQAGLWLYVDQLDRSHDISQIMKNPTGSFWHGIMHRREGDFGNSHYWFRQTGHHPAMDLIPDYDGHRFVDEAEAAHVGQGDRAAAVAMQQQEWSTLFAWCANHT